MATPKETDRGQHFGGVFGILIWQPLMKLIGSYNLEGTLDFNLATVIENEKDNIFEKIWEKYGN